MRVLFHCPGHDDLVETWPDDVTSAELQRRAVALGARMYTPEVAEERRESEDPR